MNCIGIQFAGGFASDLGPLPLKQDFLCLIAERLSLIWHTVTVAVGQPVLVSPNGDLLNYLGDRTVRRIEKNRNFIIRCAKPQRGTIRQVAKPSPIRKVEYRLRFGSFTKSTNSMH